MISCVLLTAGESKRFGSPKALAKIGPYNSIELLQQKLLESLIHEIIVVTGAHPTLIEPYVFNHSRVRLVHNKDYKFGQTSSFQTGLSAVDKDSCGFMLLPVDCPFIQTKTINAIIRCFLERNPSILIPTYHGKKGHPPILHAQLKNEILDLPKDQGLNSLMARHQTQTIEIDDKGIVQTFNSKEEFDKIVTGTNY